ncbi:hypothetical protein RF11_14575 [Thelohanellus kitauei]|uniref:39S ribosomal protein L46, mitochondrial n=1 Tax=Thelohanellus kitauei TaxID=669202 RepID=A0A0C2ITD1_THEKT|nr:hypothetical protein RF11_14575 [Thelohanellus kitauei]
MHFNKFPMGKFRFARVFTRPCVTVQKAPKEILLANANPGKVENVGVGVLIERLNEYRINPLMHIISRHKPKTRTYETSRRARASETSRTLGSNSADLFTNPASLYLMVHSSIITRHEWFPPSALIYNNTMPLSQAAMRLTRTMIKNKNISFCDIDSFLLTCQLPIAQIRFKLPLDHPWKPGEDALIFIFKMYTRNKKLIINKKIIDDYCWLDNNEVMKKLSADVSMQLEPFLSD